MAGIPPLQTLCVICPCHDEAEGIEAFYDELTAVLERECGDLSCHVVFIDDGSTDRTLDILKGLAARDERVLVYSFTRNFGHQVALSAGLDVASADAVILMDSDLQHPPEIVPCLIERWREGYDVVSAVRLGTDGAPIFKKWTSRAFYALFNLLSEVKLVPGVADFVLLSRSAHRALLSMPERHRFMRAMVAWTGYRRTQVSYQAQHRVAGASSYTARRMLALGLDAVFSFTARPIRMATKLGLTIGALGFGYLIYVVLRVLVYGDTVAGWGSVLSTVLLLGGMQLVFIGLIGEYLARIFEEVKGRPLYLFADRPSPERERRAFFGDAVAPSTEKAGPAASSARSSG